MRWKDGEVVHVHLTEEVYRGYCQRMKEALEALEKRLVSFMSLLMTGRYVMKFN